MPASLPRGWHIHQEKTETKKLQTDVSGVLLIPFGVERFAIEDLAVARRSDGGAHVPGSFPCAVIDRNRRLPLRLNNSFYDLAFKPLDATEDDLASNLRDCIKLECDIWNTKALGFVDGYFEALKRLVVADEAAIAREAVGFGKLFDNRDWIFSAPRPLPRAHLIVGETDPIPVDFAFWTGSALVALDLSAGSMMPAKARERERRLLQADIELIVSIPSNDVGWAQFLSRLAPPGGSFWQGEILPLGPFASKALDMLIET
jgi:hypothetical protein